MEYKKDKDLSDYVIKKTKEIYTNNYNIFKEYFKKLNFKDTTIQKDQDNSIDVYINQIPIQYRFQRLDNKKNCKYYPTIRYTRENSCSDNQKDSEYFKIKNNIINKLPYPELLIWGLVDNDLNIVYLYIIDILKLFKDIDDGYYYIQGEDKTNVQDIVKGNITKKKNSDGSSEFIILEIDDDWDCVKFKYNL